MSENMFMTADDVADELKVSKAFAYKVIKKFNEELDNKGYFTIAGKVNRQYFMERVYYKNEMNSERK